MTEPNANETESGSVPPQIGHYLIQKQIGAGGMGTVYLGEHVETHRQAAIKILPASLSREPGFVARFGREIAAMQHLKSPHIVELYESGEENGIYFYAMEYVAGETLTARLKREKRLPWREVIDLGVQVCKALKSAHNSGIIHRDLKPSNLLLDDADQVKLTDFGIAQVFATSKLTVTGGIVGTAEYMSPEQAQGNRATRQSDLYSLGAVLYVMLTGRPPFTGKTTLDIIQKHRFSQFDSPRRIVPDIPHWLDEIVCKCLSKKPEDRYPDAYVLMLRLQEVPRKVDLRESEEGDLYSGQPENETVAQTGSNEPHQQVGGTLVRDLFRAQMETEERPTYLGRLLDNGFVLGTLLVLLLGGVGLYFYFNRISPEQRFARGKELMSQPEGNSWDVARTEYFTPLLEIDEATWRPRIDPYLEQLELYDLKKQILGRKSKLEVIPRSEPDAILKQAIELRNAGRIGEAKKKLAALQTLAAGSESLKSISTLARKLHEELHKIPVTQRLGYVMESLSRANELHQSGKTDEARAIWRSVQELYDADPDAHEFVQQARKHLEETAPAASPPSSPVEDE